MNGEGLVVSAATNIGLASLILTLFSILRKQPSNSVIYYPRRLSQLHRLSFDRQFTFRRLLPSVQWIRRAYGVSEEEILDTFSLDVLVLIRLFKFGIEMESNSLLASVGINLGLSFIILFLFSILKKQPSNVSIYYARLFSVNDHITFNHSNFFLQFVPSFGWVSSALKVSKDEILEITGLDALVLLRVFKFGINFFLVCSLVRLLILLPLNYITGGSGPSKLHHSTDSFTISNISKGSNWLWVHLLCLYFVSCYGLYLLYKEYEDISLKRLQQLRDMRHQPNQFTVLVREIPPCDEHKARGCSVDHYFSKYHPHSYRSYQILYDGKDLRNLLTQAKSILKKIENLKRHASTKKHNKGPDLSDALIWDAKLVRLKEVFQEVCHKIRITQSRMLQQGKELPVAFVTFNSRWGATLAAQSQQNSNPLMWTTEMAPEPRDVLWKNLAIPYKHLPLHKCVLYVAASLLTIFFMIPVTAVQGIAKFEQLKKWFPPAMAVQLIPGLRSVVTGYLPSAILSIFIYIVPFAMIEMTKLAGYVSKSRKDMKACNLVFYFLVGNVFFLSLLSGSLLDQIGKSFFHLKDFPSRLATAVSAQADFFMTYILTNGLSGFSLEILQPGLLIWDMMKSHTWDRGNKKGPYLYCLPYCRIIPSVSLCILIGMVYAVVSPLLLPFLVGYFCLGYIVFIHQIQDVYITTYETSGQYWPYIYNYIIIAMIITQISMIGLFGLKSKPSASFSTIPLLVYTILFNEYCRIRFLPTFYQCSVKDALDRDELDKKAGLMEGDLQNAIDAYSPPCLRPLNYEEMDSTSMLPLLSSM